MRLREVRRNDISYRLELLPKYYGNSTLIDWQGETFVLGRGTEDWWLAAIDLDDPDSLYILSGNYRLGYIGLSHLHPEYNQGQHWTQPEYVEPESVFMQDPDDSNMGAPQPKPWHEYAWYTQVRRLAERLPV